MTLRVLYEDRELCVVDKPAGLEATGKTLDDPRSVQHRLARQLRRPVWAIHQLDRDTTGVLVFVRRASLVAPWQRALAEGTKTYLAIAHGVPAWTAQLVDAPLRYDEGLRRWTVGEGKPARTRVRALASGEGFTLFEVELLTGRTHQARVHLAHLGHPLAGERRYRDPPSTVHPRHALHAARLDIDGRSFEAPLPEDLRVFAERAGLCQRRPGA